MSSSKDGHTGVSTSPSHRVGKEIVKESVNVGEGKTEEERDTDEVEETERGSGAATADLTLSKVAKPK